MAYLSPIARVTLLEAVRFRLFIMSITVVLGLSGLAGFLGELSITETSKVQVSVTASLLRVFSIVIVCLFVITSVLKELNDKGLEILLSLSMPRYAYLFGKFSGFAGIALCISLMACLPLLLYVPAVRVSCWFLSLVCEHLLIISLSLACLLTFSGASLAFVAVMSFYLLSRSMEALSLLSASPILAADTVAQDFIYLLVAALALVLPELHVFTRSDWLVYGVDVTDMGTVLTQTLVYLAVLLSVGLFDLYRKNL